MLPVSLRHTFTSFRLIKTQNLSVMFNTKCGQRIEKRRVENDFNRATRRRLRSTENSPALTPRAICRGVNGRVSKTNTCVFEQLSRGHDRQRRRNFGGGPRDSKTERNVFWDQNLFEKIKIYNKIYVSRII